MADLAEFFVEFQATGLTPTFELYEDFDDVALAQPTIDEVGSGIYRFRPTDRTNGVVFSMTPGNGEQNVTGAITKDSTFDPATTGVELLDSGGSAGTSADELVDDILKEVVSDHSGTAGSLAQLIDNLRKRLFNRQVLDESSSPSTLTVYEDDNTTPFVSGNVEDKNGNDTNSSSGVATETKRLT